MSDEPIYIDVGPMSTNTDTTKVALKFQRVAATALRAQAVKVIGLNKKFTMDPKGMKRGYTFNAKLAEVVYGKRGGQNSVTCNLTGSIYHWPHAELLTTTLTATATGIGSVADRDVELTMKDAIEDMLKIRVLPTLLKRPAPQAAPKAVRP